MSKSHGRGTKQRKDQSEIVGREITRVFDAMNNRMPLGACAPEDRLGAVMEVVKNEIFHPARMKVRTWLQLVYVRLRTFKRQGVLQFGSGNVARLSRRQFKRASRDGREWPHSRAQSSREGRRGTDRSLRPHMAY